MQGALCAQIRAIHQFRRWLPTELKNYCYILIQQVDKQTDETDRSVSNANTMNHSDSWDYSRSAARAIMFVTDYIA